jgi:hypothetical protein
MGAAVVLFVYRRPEHTQRTLASLARCWGASETDLWVFSDGPRTEADRDFVDAVRKVVHSASGFRSVQVSEAAANRGLAASVIDGVGQVLARSGACIVVEDDLDLAPGFLEFLNGALEHYAEVPEVFSLSGYAPPVRRVRVEPQNSVWFAPRPCSWGWATWKDRWDRVDWSVTDRKVFFEDAEARRRLESGGRDLAYFLRLQLRGDLDSWAVRMAWSQSRVGGLTLYPARSFVANHGLDGSGTHSRDEGDQGIDLAQAALPLAWPSPYLADQATLRRFRRHYEGSWSERWGHRWRKLGKLVLRWRK